MDGKTILPRGEVPEEFTWDLSDVFASDDKWSEELEALKAYPERMAAYAGKLGESAKTAKPATVARQAAPITGPPRAAATATERPGGAPDALASLKRAWNWMA